MMILPWLQGIVGFFKAPGTWVLFALNILFAALTFPQEWDVDRQVDKLMTHDFLETSGKFYADYLERNPHEGNVLLRKIARKFREGQSAGERLGHFAMRDHGFINAAPDLEYGGDQVAAERWRTQIMSLQESLAGYPATIWGLSTESKGSFQWFSHSFIHSGLGHLSGNMYFLLIFGAAVELWLGTAAFLFGYLGGGLFSAVAYLLLQGAGGSPIIGASGAISGVMGMYCAHYFRQKVPFAYVILPVPVKGLVGTFMAPAGVSLLIWMLQDLTGMLNTPVGMGGVAHAAHLGGFMAGVVLGLIFSRILPQAPAQDAKPGNLPLPRSFPKKPAA